MTIARSVAGCLLFVTVLHVVHGQQQPEYRAECVAWENVTIIQMNQNTVPMNCGVNQQCTGFDCTGEFSYSGPITGGTPFVDDFCFGIALHPCDKPLSMSFYLEKPGDMEAFQRKVTDGARFQVPGVHYDLSSFGSADGFVDITMEPQQYNGYNYVKIGAQYKTKVTMAFGLIENWPEELSFKLMPDTLVPVPDCDSRVKTDLHVPGQCTKYTPPTQPPGFTTVSPPTTGPNCSVGVASTCPNHEICKPSKENTKEGNCECTPGFFRLEGNCVLHPSKQRHQIKSCTVSELGSCGPHQICQMKSGGGKCECMQDYKWNGSACVTSSQEPTVFIIGEPAASKGKDGSGEASSKEKLIIPLAVVGVVILMAIAAAVVYVKYRRYRQRYGEHSPLSAEDDDTRDDGDDHMMEA